MVQKIFAIYCKVELINKPDWLDEFRAKYDKPYPYHITLKQSCIIDEVSVPDIRDKISECLQSITDPGPLQVIFNKLIVAEESNDDKCIMINAESNPSLYDLQRRLIEALKEHNQYFKPESEEWEKNFVPHITIARDLNNDLLERAQQDLKEDYKCEGVVKEIVLEVVDNLNPEEANNPANQTTYIL